MAGGRPAWPEAVQHGRRPWATWERAGRGSKGKVVHVGRTIGKSEGRLVGADGKLYAHGTETCLIFPL